MCGSQTNQMLADVRSRWRRRQVTSIIIGAVVVTVNIDYLSVITCMCLAEIAKCQCIWDRSVIALP